jgi:hypothetical protein
MTMFLQTVSVVKSPSSCLHHQVEFHPDHATVKRYNERDVHQEAFDDDNFFHRYDLEYRARRIIVSDRYTPK